MLECLHNNQQYVGNILEHWLLCNVNAGIREIVGMGYHVYDVQMMKTDESQLMTS